MTKRPMISLQQFLFNDEELKPKQQKT